MVAVILALFFGGMAQSAFPGVSVCYHNLEITISNERYDSSRHPRKRVTSNSMSKKSEEAGCLTIL